MNGTPPPSARVILHLDLDTFFVSVERLMDRRLAHQPILIGGTGDRGVVAACSYQTRAFGACTAEAVALALEAFDEPDAAAQIVSATEELSRTYRSALLPKELQ